MGVSVRYNDNGVVALNGIFFSSKLAFFFESLPSATKIYDFSFKRIQGVDSTGQYVQMAGFYSVDDVN